MDQCKLKLTLMSTDELHKERSNIVSLKIVEFNKSKDKMTHAMLKIKAAEKEAIAELDRRDELIRKEIMARLNSPKESDPPFSSPSVDQPGTNRKRRRSSSAEEHQVFNQNKNVEELSQIPATTTTNINIGDIHINIRL